VPEYCGVTVALKVTAWPATDGFVPLETEVVVVAWITASEYHPEVLWTKKKGGIVLPR